MPGIDRTTIITGPAIIQYDGSSFWSKGDVILKTVYKRFQIETSHHGKIDERHSDRRIEVSFEPAGQFSTAIAAVLWPYAASMAGDSIYGATDRPLVIWGRDGVKLTLNNAALTQMPNIRMGVDKTIIGGVKFTGLLANSADPTDAAAYYTIAAAAYPGDGGFSIANIITETPVAQWGATPWDAFRTESGWDISFSLKLADRPVEGLGTVDMTFLGLDISAKAAPVGPTVADVLTALRGDLALGASLGTTDLVLSSTVSGGAILTLPNMVLTDAECAYGAQKKRIGNCEWVQGSWVTDGYRFELIQA